MTKNVLREKYVARGIATIHPIVIDRASGVELIDIEGKVYIDFCSGIGATNLGHGNDRIIKAIEWQSKKLLHMCFMVAYHEPYLELAKKTS